MGQDAGGVVMIAPTRPALRYFGGKWRLAPWIISHFPEHTCYVEPFAGGASVLLRKPESKVEVLNDLDGEVVNFWRVLREQTEAFIRAVELTPFSREEASLAYQVADDPLERARRLFIRSWQQRGGGTSRPVALWVEAFDRRRQGQSSLPRLVEDGSPMEPGGPAQDGPDRERRRPGGRAALRPHGDPLLRRSSVSCLDPLAPMAQQGISARRR